LFAERFVAGAFLAGLRVAARRFGAAFFVAPFFPAPLFAAPLFAAPFLVAARLLALVERFAPDLFAPPFLFVAIVHASLPDSGYQYRTNSGSNCWQVSGTSAAVIARGIEVVSPEDASGSRAGQVYAVDDRNPI